MKLESTSEVRYNITAINYNDLDKYFAAIGLPNPIDRDAAANKNYVDNRRAIAKDLDGGFTKVADIDFNGLSLKKHP